LNPDEPVVALGAAVQHLQRVIPGEFFLPFDGNG
jgi:hypothetical protein